MSNLNGKQMRTNITICWRTIYWVMLALGLLISIGGLFLNVSVTSSLITYIFSIDHLLSDSTLSILKFLQVNMVAAGILIIILSIPFYKYNQKKHGQSLELEIEYDLKKLIISSSVLVGLFIFLFSIFIQAAYVENLCYTMGGLSDDEKRAIQFGDFYKFVENCSEQIPENDSILTLNCSWFTNYYLYPRKSYYPPNSSFPLGNPYSSISLENISKDWLEEKGIKWVLSYDPINFSLNESRIIKLGEAKNV